VKVPRKTLLNAMQQETTCQLMQCKKKALDLVVLVLTIAAVAVHQDSTPCTHGSAKNHPIRRNPVYTIHEQFSAATKTNFEAQIAMMSMLFNKTFESLEKFVDLNMNAAKTSLEESTVTAKQILAAKDPQEFFSLTAAQAQPTAEKTLAYGRHLANIASNTQAALTQAVEEQISDTNRKIISLIEEVTKNAPAGSESAIAFVKSTIGNTTAGYEQFTKATQHVAKTLEDNLNTATSQFVQAAEKSAARAKKQ
jgi:phasin family protein